MPELHKTTLQSSGLDRPHPALPAIVSMHCGLWNEKRRIKLRHRDPELGLFAEINPRGRIVALDENAPLLGDTIAFEANADDPSGEGILGTRAKTGIDR
jgi:hypothetical protein